MTVEYSDEEKVKYSMYILSKLLPFLQQLYAEQMVEKEIESQLQGKFLAVAGQFGRVIL